MADVIPIAYLKDSEGRNVSLKEYTPTDRIPAQYLTAQAPNLYGTYTARPAANAVPTGTLYSASDTKEVYLSNGAAWSRVGINSGRIAYAERTTPYQTTSDSFAVVPGMSLVVPACEVAAAVQYGATMQTASSNTTGVLAAFCDGVQIGQILVGQVGYTSYAASAQLPAKTPGTNITIELRARQANAGTVFNIFGDQTDRPYLRVISN